MGRAIPRPVGRWRFRSQGLGAFSEPSAPPRMKTRTWSSHLSADVCIGRAQCHPPRKASGRPKILDTSLSLFLIEEEKSEDKWIILDLQNYPR